MITSRAGRMVDQGTEVKSFGRVQEIVPLPNLVEIQTRAYEEFLAPDIPSGSRKDEGLEALLREVFPIYSYDKTMCLEYVGYELGRPRYTIDECRKLRMSFGYPFKVRLRLVKPEPVEEEVYLGEIPIMLGGGDDTLLIGKGSKNNRVLFMANITADGGIGDDSRNDIGADNKYGPAATYSESAFETLVPTV